MSMLEVRGLGKRFGPVEALADVDLDIAAGSRTAVVGPSGSGKTTLLRLIGGFETPDAGTITLDGALLADATRGLPAHRRNVGLVMQEGALFPHLSILDNIRFGIRGAPDAAARALKLMDMVELERAMADRQPHQLSGGQQQRVALARALARQPRLMLLDEPFSALDTGLREQLRLAVSAILAAAGIASLLVTHDQEEAMSFADQLVVLRDGRLVQKGPPRALYLTPRDAATAIFLGPALIIMAEIDNGVATTPFGPLRVEAASVSGRAEIMLRPEQVRLQPADAAATPWRVQAVEYRGALARVTIAAADASAPLTLELVGQDIPAIGAAVALQVSGRAHLLG